MNGIFVAIGEPGNGTAPTNPNPNPNPNLNPNPNPDPNPDPDPNPNQAAPAADAAARPRGRELGRAPRRRRQDGEVPGARGYARGELIFFSLKIN